MDVLGILILFVLICALIFAYTLYQRKQLIVSGGYANNPASRKHIGKLHQKIYNRPLTLSNADSIYVIKQNSYIIVRSSIHDNINWLNFRAWHFDKNVSYADLFDVLTWIIDDYYNQEICMRIKFIKGVHNFDLIWTLFKDFHIWETHSHNGQLADIILQAWSLNCSGWVIEGFSGSGKSTLGNQLKVKGLKVIETDDLDSDAGKMLLDQHYMQFLNSDDYKREAMINQIRIPKLLDIAHQSNVVFIGILPFFHFSTMKGTYVLKPPPEDVYRHLLIRSLNSMCENRQALLDIYKTADVHLIIPWITGLKYNIHVDSISAYYQFVIQYNEYYEHLHTLGFDIKTADQILEVIK